jgi:hypothetical protein
MTHNTPVFLPVSRKETDQLGWDQPDIIIVSGDAYVDHPSFGAAVMGRMAEHLGMRVAILPQPNWRDDLRDFKKLGTTPVFLWRYCRQHGFHGESLYSPSPSPQR